MQATATSIESEPPSLYYFPPRPAVIDHATDAGHAVGKLGTPDMCDTLGRHSNPESAAPS